MPTKYCEKGQHDWVPTPQEYDIATFEVGDE